ncbi:MAG: ABC transporter ATP-binding protein [Clostridia bacterium]|nr:ABC transporter ATP-binding protein [Clostridia bacterium]
MEILKTVGLSKTYGTGPQAVEALKSADIVIRQGEFVAVVGPSGSGKSTLLHLLGGLDRPTAGNVYLEGKDIYSLPENDLAVLRRRKFGFIFQFYNLIPVLSAHENIVLPLLLDHKEIDKEYIEDLIGILGLADRIDHLPNMLSGGQQQRVAIGRALANKPSIIFADEPTGNLDTKTGKEVLDLIRISIKKYHQTLVMITHDPQVAASADRMITIEDGKIVGDKAVV